MSFNKTTEETEEKPPSSPAGQEEQKKFSWVTVDNLTVPCILRDNSKFVAVRMMESKLLARYPSQSAQELHNMPPLASFYMSKSEADLLTSVNNEQCSKQFGEDPFTERDLIVKLGDFREFYSAVKKLFSGKLSEQGGWCQINHTLIPYIIRADGEKFVPLNVIRYAAGLLNNTKVVYVYPTEEECFLLNEKCKTASMNFVFTVSTKLVSLDRVREVCLDIKMVDNPKSVFPSTPAFPNLEPNSPDSGLFSPKSSPVFPFPEMMPWGGHDTTGLYKDLNMPWVGPSSPMYSDSLSTPRAAMMLERMAAWSKLQEELHLNNLQNSNPSQPEGNNSSLPGMQQNRPIPGNSISNIDQQSILQKIGVNVNIHLNGKFEGQDSNELSKNKRKGQNPHRYSPTNESLDGSEQPAIRSPPSLNSLTGSNPVNPLSNDCPVGIGRQAQPMFNFRPGALHRPSMYGSILSPHSVSSGPLSTGTASLTSSPLGSLPVPPLSQNNITQFGHPPSHMMPPHLAGMQMWKYDYFKNSMLNPMDKLVGESGIGLRHDTLRNDNSRSETDRSSPKERKLLEKSCTSDSRTSPRSSTPGQEGHLAKSQNLEIIVDGIRCTPIVGKVLLQTKTIPTLFHENLGCDLVLLEDVGKEFFQSTSPDTLCDLMHIAVSILHMPTFNLMASELGSTMPSWQPKVALRLEDLVKHVDILKFLVTQKKEKQKLHMQSLTNNNIPTNLFGNLPDLKRSAPRESSIEQDIKCKIPRISPSPLGQIGLSGPLGMSLNCRPSISNHFFPQLGHVQPEFNQWSHGADSSAKSSTEGPSSNTITTNESS